MQKSADTAAHIQETAYLVHREVEEAAGYSIPHINTENYQPFWLPRQAKDTPSSLLEQTQMLCLSREKLQPFPQHEAWHLHHSFLQSRT